MEFARREQSPNPLSVLNKRAMKNRSERLGLVRSLLALSVSFAVVLSATALSFAGAGNPSGKSSAESALKKFAAPEQNSSAPNELKITAATAIKTTEGVLLQWRTNSTTDNVGFNIYREKGGKRTRANREIIPGAAFGPPPAMMRGGYSYGWLDRSGTADSVYYIESINLQGATKLHDALGPVVNQSGAGTQTPESSSGTESADQPERSYPAGGSPQLNLPNGQLEDQFAIAAQTALKIAVKKDGWYRVTQPQMVAAGFNPTVDIRNLRLFGEAKEVAISTSQSSGQFGASDYIEFYGRRLDTPTTDARIYYLVAGTTPGKRVIGQNRTNGDDGDDAPPIGPPPPPVATPTPAPVSSSPVSVAPAPAQPVLNDRIFFPMYVGRDYDWLLDGGLKPGTALPKRDGGNSQSDQQPAASTSSEPVQFSGYNPVSRARKSANANEALDAVAPVSADVNEQKENAQNTASSETPSVVRLPVAAKPAPDPTPVARAAATAQFRKGKTSRKKKRTRSRRATPRPEHSHAVFSLAAAPANYENIVERRDRGIYFVAVLNGEKENYFGQVLAFVPSPGNPATMIINSPNPDISVAAPAKLEIALQGANAGFHQISIEFNGVNIGQFAFNGFDPSQGGNPVQTFDIPLAQLHDGANTIKFIVPSTGDLSVVDYAKLTYPHLYKADSGSLRFTLGGTQTRTVDGFATRNVRLIDYTDPFNCIVIKPDTEPTASGFKITVPVAPVFSKSARLLSAVPQNQFETAASLTLSQPSTLNTGNLSATATHGADFLIISHKTLLASWTPLLNLRQSQGKTVAAVDIEDVFDEFSYGAHGPQAIKDFLSYANTNWVTKPKYIIFGGDASLDPRNYEGFGNLDLVPTKLLDATYNETASDEWMVDFDNDGVGEIPSGRLPVRTTAEADLVVSKIVNYSPAVVPQAALLIADDPGTPPLFDFETGNDQVQALLPASMTVQRVNVRLDGSGPSTTAIFDGINQGRIIVNYSGHGTLDSWASSVIFTKDHAAALTNGMNKLTFVIVMDCLNGYFQAPNVQSLSEAFLKSCATPVCSAVSPTGGAVAVFASSGLTTTPGQREMELELYRQLYGPTIMPVGDAIKIAKTASNDIDVRRTWIYFGDPSMKIR